jgi:hypothetical protein
VVLPQVSAAKFVLESGQDINWLKHMLSAEYIYPQFYRAITKVSFPGFHWFSGINHNRTENHFLTAAANFVNLRDLGLSFHTAGLTHSIFGEKQRMEIERTDLEKSKELMPYKLIDVVDKYGLEALFHCKELVSMTLTCIDSDIVAHHVKHTNPVNLVHEIAGYFREGYLKFYHRHITVNVVVVDVNGVVQQ